MTEIVSCKRCRQEFDIEETEYLADAMEAGYFCPECARIERREIASNLDPRNHPSSGCGCGWH